MLLFCPTCTNMLTISKTPAPAAHPSVASSSASAATQPNRFECRTCPYQYILDKRYFDRKEFARSSGAGAGADVLGGREEWANVDRTDVKCVNEMCPGTQAFFYQVQIRSADEPMTSFYRCCVCAREWREG